MLATPPTSRGLRSVASLVVVIALACVKCCEAQTPPYWVSTVAGSGGGGFKDGMGKLANFNTPQYLAVDPSGTMLYISDTYNHAIRRVVVATGNTTTIAGSGVAGWADGVGSLARFNMPNGIAVDNANAYLYVVDTGNCAIRKLRLATGAVQTIIGKQCTSASSDCASGLAGCCSPTLLVGGCTDNGATYACYSPGVGTSASLGSQANGLAISYTTPASAVSGALYVANTEGGYDAGSDSVFSILSVVDLSASPVMMGTIAKVHPNNMQGVALDSWGNLYFAMYDLLQVQQCAFSGFLTTLATCSQAIGTGNYYSYVSGTDSSSTSSSSGSGAWTDEVVATPLTAGLISPFGVAGGSAGVFISDGHVIRLATLFGGSVANVTTIAGGGAGTYIPGIASRITPGHWKAPGPLNTYLPASGFSDGLGTTAALNRPAGMAYHRNTSTLYFVGACPRYGYRVLASLSLLTCAIHFAVLRHIQSRDPQSVA